MSPLTAKRILLCLALLLTASASYFEFQAIGAAFTAGDVVGPVVQQDQQWIHHLERQSNIYTAEAAACVVLAALFLGTAFGGAIGSVRLSCISVLLLPAR